MHRSLKQEGTGKGTLNLAPTGGLKGCMFGESTGPVDNIPSDVPLGGNRKCTEHGIPVVNPTLNSLVSGLLTVDSKLRCNPRSNFPTTLLLEIPLIWNHSHLFRMTLFPLLRITLFSSFQPRLVIRQKATDARSMESLHDHTQVGPTHALLPGS
jgi:hypothetical protein